MRPLWLILLVACGEPKAAPPPQPTTERPPEPRSWPVAPAPSLPAELATLAWPPALDELEPFEQGRGIDGGTAYGVTIPTTFPRVWIQSDLDLRALEAAWGTLARDHGGSAVWWNPAAKIRARFDAAHPTPSLGRGIELAPYASTIDRVANLDEIVVLAPSPSFHIPPGEWDPAPIQVKSKASEIKLTTRVDAAPVDAAAVIAKLTEIYGAPEAVGTVWTFPKGRVVVRRVEQFPALEITYVAP